MRTRKYFTVREWNRFKNNDYFDMQDMLCQRYDVIFTVYQTTREKIFLFLHEEIPYSSTVETEGWITNKSKSITIDQTIYVSKKNHVGIVLGKGGKMIKSIGIASREDIEKILNNKVNLKINVKYKKDWSTKKEHYEDIGLNF